MFQIFVQATDNDVDAEHRGASDTVRYAPPQAAEADVAIADPKRDPARLSSIVILGLACGYWSARYRREETMA